MVQGKELTSKRLKARHLIIVKGFQQKEAAQIVGVSPKTICHWVKKYKWKDGVEKEVRKMGGTSAVVEMFFEYVRSTQQPMVEPIKKLWFAFMRKLEEDLG